MFGALTFDRDPLAMADVPAGIMTWFQVAGGLSFFSIILWLALGLPRMRRQDRDLIPRWLSTSFLGLFFLAAACYILALVAALVGFTGSGKMARFAQNAYAILLTSAGVSSFLAAALTFLHNLSRLRFRRIFALA
jgi:hypothetical protein